MLSIRTGWPRKEVRSLTIREARLTLEELARIDDAREARDVEAQHNPNALFERSKAKAGPVKGMDGWKQAMAKLDPKALEDFEIKEAALKFIKEKKSRGG